MLHRAQLLHQWLLQHEAKSFLAWALLHTLPVLLPAFFMSYDGPAHLYNSRLLAEWLGSNRDWLEQFVFLQQEPLPNWLTYPLLAGLGELFNYFWADKLLQILYVLGMLYAFRYLVRSFNTETTLLSWLGGVLVFHHITGMYNFSMSLPLLMFILGYYQRIQGKFTIGNTTLLLLASLLLYFSHLTGYLAAGLLCGLLWMAQNAQALSENRFQSSKAWRSLGATFLFFLPSLVMAVSFILKRSGNASSGFTLAQLLHKLGRMDALILFNTDKEFDLLRWLYVVAALVIIARWRSFFKGGNSLHPLALGMLAMLILYLIVPDASMGASFTSMRLQLFFLSLALAWLATQALPWRTELMSWSITVVISLALLWHYGRAWEGLSKDVAQWAAAGAEVPNRSRVLTLNYSTHWYHEHISNFLGLDTPLILLYENYEATNDYFPFRFQPETLENYRQLRPLLAWPPQPEAQSLALAPQLVDVVVRWRYDAQNPAQKHPGLDSLLTQYYQAYYRSEQGHLELFKRKLP
ncbi:MAG: hypothetical protein Q8J69_06920 [Sphingobacteriaceae bacterium]|nr:hypothetical protein [Sphingobacteriaceae bacterium]